eukprot:scaffold7571_cov130-Isochrysis_galbana.AAC.1
MAHRHRETGRRETRACSDKGRGGIEARDTSFSPLHHPRARVASHGRGGGGWHGLKLLDDLWPLSLIRGYRCAGRVRGPTVPTTHARVDYRGAYNHRQGLDTLAAGPLRFGTPPLGVA